MPIAPIHEILSLRNPALVLPPSGRQNQPFLGDTWLSLSTVTRWEDFNLTFLNNAFADILRQPSSIDESAANISAAYAVENITFLKRFGLKTLVDRLRGPIADGARYLGMHLGSQPFVSNEYDAPLFSPEGDGSPYRPSVTFYVNNNPSSQTNLVVSTVRISSAWTSRDLASGVPGAIQPLNQLATYACHGQTRYSFLLTDQELVVVRVFMDEACPGRYGAEWQAVPWAESGEGRLTACQAVWFLTMMSLNDHHRAVQTRSHTLPVNVWLKEKDITGRDIYRHHLSMRQVPFLPTGEHYI
ncbi:hypothetical protein ACJ41O_008728 [Fusarium nematophilum]